MNATPDTRVVLHPTRSAPADGIYTDGTGAQFFVRKNTAYPAHYTYVGPREGPPVQPQTFAVYDVDEAMLPAGVSGVYRMGPDSEERVIVRRGDLIPRTYVVEEYHPDDAVTTYDKPAESVMITRDNWSEHLQSAKTTGLYADEAGNTYRAVAGDAIPRSYRYVGPLDPAPLEDDPYGRRVAHGARP